MLTIPIERITAILDRASDVEPADLIASEVAADSENADQEIADEAGAGEYARRALFETLERLSQGELYELLALAELAELDDISSAWSAAMQRARDISAEDVIARLARALVLSDAIEVGLDRLGYDMTGGREADDETPVDNESQIETNAGP